MAIGSWIIELVIAVVLAIVSIVATLVQEVRKWIEENYHA